jgi:hypothetical protein
MLENIKDKAVTWGWGLSIVVISFILFIYIIQPMLIDIHPMFATQPQISGRRPNTPGGLAYFITLTMCFIISIPFYIVISEYIYDWEE